MRHYNEVSTPDSPPRLSRRELLIRAAVIAAAAGTTTLAGCAAKGNSAPSTGRSTPERRFATKPKWEQDFRNMRDGSLDSRFWNVRTGNTIPGYNNEAETFTDRSENVEVRNGALRLVARKQNRDHRHYTSARVDTQNKVAAQYGRWEVDLKMPKGVGTWPAAWLLANGEKYNPRKLGVPINQAPWPLEGEIDFLEGVGAQPGQVYPDVHTYNTVKAGQEGTDHLTLPDDDEVFHTYGVDISPDSITFTLNGNGYHTVNRESNDPRSWPFDQPYYLILDLAMGGTWGGEDHQQYPPYGIEGDGPWEMAVRGVRYFEPID